MTKEQRQLIHQHRRIARYFPQKELARSLKDAVVWPELRGVPYSTIYGCIRAFDKSIKLEKKK